MIADALESLIRYAQSKLIEDTQKSDDKTLVISCAGLLRNWEPGNYKTGDIRVDMENKRPYECIQDHDSIINPNWTIKERALWKPYHSRSAEWALPWEQPTGSHDRYRNGEYMIWTDGTVKKCIEDTNFSPDEYPAYWEN